MLCLVLFVLCLSRSGKCNFFFFQAELQMVNIFFSAGQLAAACWDKVGAVFPSSPS